MPMERARISDETVARGELGTARNLPFWREARRAMPFRELSPDEFEILCFLLLRKEFPKERIFYYGKTADAGRDIVHHRPDGSIRLIQCKRFATNVGSTLLKAELAKLFTNVFSGMIPERPNEVVFYIVPDITSPAAGLIDKQSNWKQAAAKALRQHTGKAVPKELLDFAITWWPIWDRDNDIGLTDRLGNFPDLRDEFFTVRKVIDASRKEIQRDIRDAIEPVATNIETLLSHPLFANPAIASALANLAALSSSFAGTGIRSANANRDDDSAARAILSMEARFASEIGGALGLSPTSVLQALGSHDPPPLPSAHVARSDTTDLFARCLRQFPTLTIVGYAECGKTIALSEFARSQSWPCLWFSASATSPGIANTNATLLLLALSDHLGAGSLAIDEIRCALVGWLSHSRLLLIIDDAHFFGDLSATSFLQELAASQPDRLRVVFGSTDEPGFVADVRSRGISITRMPGMSSLEATALFASMGIAEAAKYQTEIDLLCTRCDGHVGLLRLAAKTILMARDRCTLGGLFAAAAEGATGDAAHLYSALMVRFRSSLTDEEFQLCRRLTVSLGAFQRRLAQALWSMDRRAEEFQDAWNRCVLSVFEAHDGARFSIPTLYQLGLKDYSDPATIRLWHEAAADTLAQPVGAVFNILDVCDAIAHRVLSGAGERALEQACGFLAHAADKRQRNVTAFLLSSFQVWLKGIASSPTTSRASRICWYTLRTRLCWEVKRRNEASEAASLLLSVLGLAAEGDAGETDDAAWAVLLLHASVSGTPELAMRAFEALPSDHMRTWSPEVQSGRVFLLLSAFLQARRNPLVALTKVISTPGAASNAELWSNENSYPFWRGVAVFLYSTIDTEAVSDSTVAGSCIEQLRSLQAAAAQRGASEIAILLGATLVRLLIDVMRDFRAARVAAIGLAELDGYEDVRVKAYVQHILGDAFRCAGEMAQAIEAYKTALELWPASETFDRNQASLLLGIATSRHGDHRLGHKLAYQAALSMRRDDPESPLCARAFFEAFAIAIHANALPAALRCLLAAHKVLCDHHRTRPEWAMLAQCAMTLALETERPSEPTPIPGFTLGLRESIPGMEEMLPAAPTLMMASACGALRRPYRALYLLDRALSEVNGPNAIAQAGYIGWGVAVRAELLEPAAKYGAIAAMMAPDVWPPSHGVTFDKVIFDYVVGKVVNLAVNVPPEEAHLLDAARLAIGQELAGQSRAVRLLSESLTAIAEAYQSGEPGPLDSAFQTAIRCSGLFVARDLAWFWCFRFHQVYPRPNGEMLLWHWRLSWLSITIGGTDSKFFDAYCDQAESLWTRLRTANSDPLIDDVCNALAAGTMPSRLRVEKLLVCLALHLCREGGAKVLLSEITQAVRHVNSNGMLRQIIAPVVAKCLDILLHPAAREVVDDLRAQIDELRQAVEASAPSPSLDEWKVAMQRLLSIADVLRTGQLTAAAFVAIWAFAEALPELSPASEATLYVWLRHSFGTIERDQAIFERIMGLLRSPRVVTLLANSDVPPALRRRLGICHASASGQLAISKLARAYSKLIIQESSDVPVRPSAIQRARSERDDAVKEAIAITESLDSIEQELCNETEQASDLWSCCHERGGLRKLIGTLLCIQGGELDEGQGWLRRSLVDFQKAVSAATTDASETVRSANEALIIAEFLELEADTEVIKKGLTEAAEKLGEAQTSLLLDAGNALDPLRAASRGRDKRPPRQLDEEDIQRYVDDLMSAMELPPDRRRAVEDDVRKQMRISEVQNGFCKHLQPLQNLTHTQSPATAYLLKTRYTCSCTLLGYQTVIENDDIDVVINAMQKTYCEGCSRREPLGISG